MARPLALWRRRLLRPSPSPPRRLRTGKRQGLHLPPVHHRLGPQRRNRIVLKDSRRKKLVNDPVQRRFRLRKDRRGLLRHTLLEPKRTNRRNQNVGNPCDQTRILVSEDFIHKIFRRKFNQVHRLFANRSRQRLFRKLYVRRQPLILPDVNVILQTCVRQKRLRSGIFGQPFFRELDVRKLQVFRRHLQVIVKRKLFFRLDEKFKQLFIKQKLRLIFLLIVIGKLKPKRRLFRRRFVQKLRRFVQRRRIQKRRRKKIIIYKTY